jgi:hypothetical protein
MMWLRQYRRRASWLGLAAVLLLAYTGQIIPHDHPDPGHAEPLPEPDRHEHHKNHSHNTHDAHSAGEETQDAQESPESAHHHHDLDGHLDTHFLRIFTHALNSGPDVALTVIEIRGLRDREPDRANWLELDLWMPASIPIFPLDSRGPPAIA